MTSTARQSRYHESRSFRISATLVGSRLTRPHARAATPVHPWEIAMIPMESGPGWKNHTRISHFLSKTDVSDLTFELRSFIHIKVCLPKLWQLDKYFFYSIKFPLPLKFEITLWLIFTFIPGIWIHSTAVPVAFERNSVKVSSAIDTSLKRKIKNGSKYTSNELIFNPLTNNILEISNYPAGLASFGGRWEVACCWPLVTTDSQLLSVVASVAACTKTVTKLNIIPEDL